MPGDLPDTAPAPALSGRLVTVVPVGGQGASPRESLTRRKAGRLLICSLAIFAFAFAVRLPHCTNHIFLVDSANYIRAANNGVWSQYMGTDGISVLEFLHRRQAGGTFRLHPWSALSDSGDGAALRHFHSPGSFYIYAVTQRWNGTPFANRIVTAVISSATVALVSGIALFEGVPLLVAVLGAIVLSLSPALLVAGTDMTPHPFFSLAATAAIAAFAFYWTSRRAVWLALWVVTTAAALVTLEFAVLLLAAFVLMLLLIFWQLRGSGDSIRELKRLFLAAVGLIAALFAFWPAGFLRGGYALSYGTLIFQGAFRQREKRDFLTTIVRLGSGHLSIGLLYGVLFGLGLYSAFRNRRSVLIVTTAVYTSLMLFEGKGNGFSNPTYASHFLYALVLLTSLSIRSLLHNSTRGSKLAAAASVCILVSLATVYGYVALRAQPEQWTQEPSRLEAAIQKLKTSYQPGTTFVVNNYAEPMTTYAPEFHFVPTLNGETLTAQPWEKVGPHYLVVYTKTLTEARPAICLQPLAKDFVISCEKLLATQEE